jgi:hypothetical protein
MKMYFKPSIHVSPLLTQSKEINTRENNVVCSSSVNNDNNDNDMSFEIPDDIIESIIKEDESSHSNNNNQCQHEREHEHVYKFTKPISTRKITPLKTTKINFNSILSSLSSLTSHNPTTTTTNSPSIQHSFEHFCFLYTHPHPYTSSLITQQHHFNTILSNITNSTTTTLTPTFTGPYIIGSTSLSIVAFPTEIDLLYTCSNLHALYSHNNFIIKNLIVTTCVNICKVEYDTFVIDHTSVSVCLSAK